MYSSSRAHTTLSPHPISRSPTAAIIGEEATSSQCPRRSPKDTNHASGPLAHEQGEWSRSRHKFWIYESPPSSSSQDGRSNASSGGNSAGSEGSEERRACRTVSPYGSFFAEEMEFDTPTESLSFYGGNGQETATVYTNVNGVSFHPAGMLQSTRSWTSSQTQVARTPGPVHFVTAGSEYPTYARPPPGPLPVPIHDATGTVRRVPLSQST